MINPERRVFVFAPEGTIPHAVAKGDVVLFFGSSMNYLRQSSALARQQAEHPGITVYALDAIPQLMEVDLPELRAREQTSTRQFRGRGAIEAAKARVSLCLEL